MLNVDLTVDDLSKKSIIINRKKTKSFEAKFPINIEI